MSLDPNSFTQRNYLSLVYSETLLTKVPLLSGVSNNARYKKIKIALIRDGESIKRFYFTHDAIVDSSMTDKESAFVALGENFAADEPAWLYDKFKIIIINPDDILYMGDEDNIPQNLIAQIPINDIPILDGVYYNYSAENSLNPNTPKLAAA